MKFLKWTALAVCTAAAFAAGAVGAGYAHAYVMTRFYGYETAARTTIDATQRVEILRRMRNGTSGEVKELLEEKLDRDIKKLSRMLGKDFCDPWGKGRQTLNLAERYRREHPWESGDPENDRIVREVLQRAAETGL